MKEAVYCACSKEDPLVKRARVSPAFIDSISRRSTFVLRASSQLREALRFSLSH